MNKKSAATTTTPFFPTQINIGKKGGTLTLVTITSPKLAVVIAHKIETHYGKLDEILNKDHYLKVVQIQSAGSEAVVIDVTLADGICDPVAFLRRIRRRIISALKELHREHLNSINQQLFQAALGNDRTEEVMVFDTSPTGEES